MNIKKLLLTATASVLTVSSIIGCGAKVPPVTESEDIRNPYSHYSREIDNSPINLSQAQTDAYDTIVDLYAEPEANKKIYDEIKSLLS